MIDHQYYEKKNDYIYSPNTLSYSNNITDTQSLSPIFQRRSNESHYVGL